MVGDLLHCPIRGTLTVPVHAKDGLTFTEEKRRIECIQLLLEKGYPPGNIKIETVLWKFGNKGRNSFRTDIAVLDAPISTLPADFDGLNEHIKLIAEIKRDSKDADTAKKTQVQPALDFLQDISCFGIYWDDIQQRLFYKTLTGTKTKTHEASIALLPYWGQKLGSTTLCRKDLRTANLLRLFGQIEDTLHSHMVDHSDRFEAMLQLLLVKLYDEYVNVQPNAVMLIQDHADAPKSDLDIKNDFDIQLKKALKYYGKYLPKAVSSEFKAPGNSLRQISILLAPTKIAGSKRDVIQDFYMYFAKGVYKWDLAQYFTPTEVVDFIVALVNPRLGDRIKDPACGSGDFLISALHHGRKHSADLSDAVWGADNSENAVQVCILNMVLNGDGKSNIERQDSLVELGTELDQFSAMLCNPPFGVKIVETRLNVLKNFDMGHTWQQVAGGIEITGNVLKSQETGLLFAELCVKQTEPGGRIGIILPNGYLGNKSTKYLAFRNWLIQHTSIVAIVGFPRFTFKKSGADVSASLVLLEKRRAPITSALNAPNHPFYAGLLESVGWSVGDKRAERIYKRDSQTGQSLVDTTNEPIIDADFDRVLNDLYTSQVTTVFNWLCKSNKKITSEIGWSVPFKSVIGRSDLSLDPKRWCERLSQVQTAINAIPHFTFEDVVDIIPPGKKPKDVSTIFDLVEIDSIGDGVARPIACRGWQLPERAKHRADKADLFVGGIWSSVNKWFVTPQNTNNMIVTNGLIRMKLKPGKEAFLLDIVAGLSTEAYRIQARAFCTGSDGLADLPAESLKTIILPKITKSSARKMVQSIVDELLSGKSTVEREIRGLISSGAIPSINVVCRQSHVVLV